MAQAQLATKIDERIKKTLEAFCQEKGLKMNKFIEEALLDKFEELQDIAELAALRREPSRPLEAILKDLKADVKL